jgi:hypothetical protein
MAVIGNKVVLVAGGLSNRFNPMRLGIVDGNRMEIDKLTRAENVDIADNKAVRMRQGRTKVYNGTPHSFWADPRAALEVYFVEASTLKQLAVDYTAADVATMTNNNPMVFEPVNDDTVISNGADIGWLKAGVYAAFNPTLGDFEAKTPAGQFLAFFNGKLYVAAGKVLIESKPYNIEVYDTRFGLFPMPAAIRMIGAVEDGLWLSTTQGVAFLRGGGGDEFVYVPRVKPAYYGAFYAGNDFKDRKVCAWVSEDGIMLGLAGGQIERVTPDDVAFPSATQGKLFKTMRDGIKQWIAVIHNPGDSNAYEPPAVTVNTQNL